MSFLSMDHGENEFSSYLGGLDFGMHKISYLFCFS